MLWVCVEDHPNVVRERRRATAAINAKPASIIAYVSGSGTAAATKVLLFEPKTEVDAEKLPLNSAELPLIKLRVKDFSN